MPKFKNLNQRQALFCQHIAAGLSGVEAFKRVTPGAPRDCDVKAAQMRRKPGVEQRIQQLMAENARSAKFTRERAIEWLERVITTPVSELTPDSPLVQSVKETDGGRELRMCDKLIALQTLGKMCNWFSREKFELEIGAADSLKNYLMELPATNIGGRWNVLDGRRTCGADHRTRERRKR